jgi:ribonuclease BN (tRNA processing enzyme)
VRVTVVGCAGSAPTPDSAASCYLVEAEDAAGRAWRVVLDLGNGALGPLQRYVDVRRLDAVLLSHLHADHCLDLCALYVVRRYHPEGPCSESLPIHGPAGTLNRLIRAYATEDAETSMPADFAVRQWSAGEPVRIGPLMVTPHRVEHPVEAYGLRVAHAGRVLGYSGDTDSCPGLMDVASDADLLLAEASFQDGRDQVRGVHLTGLRAGLAATDAGARSLVLTHLPVWTDPEVVLAGAASAYSGPIALARPGAVYRL